MTLDGRAQLIPRRIINDRPTKHTIICPCGGTLYAAPTARYARCSGGEYRCTKCLREARKFGRRGFTCGTGCQAE